MEVATTVDQYREKAKLFHKIVKELGQDQLDAHMASLYNTYMKIVGTLEERHTAVKITKLIQIAYGHRCVKLGIKLGYHR